ncbi:MAG: hypothetical protein ACREI3_07715 [Nitrospirales bacterium]
MIPREQFVPATITTLHTIDPGEIRSVTLTLPSEWDLEGQRLPIRDTMRPGNAFLARPLGSRTGKLRRRMYSRSNCAVNTPLELETIINHTHEAKADSSIWWQTDDALALHRSAGTVDVRVSLAPDGSHLTIHENSATCEPSNLRLEPDGTWEGMRVVAIALSTGLTPFLAHVRYMAAHHFGRAPGQAGAHVVLIVSVRRPAQLMAHEELLALQRQFPEHFTYYPVLTREWPADWPYGTGRIIQTSGKGNHCTGGQEGAGPAVNVAPLLAVVPDLPDRHLRYCGNASGRTQLQDGLRQKGIASLSFRTEVW